MKSLASGTVTALLGLVGFKNSGWFHALVSGLRSATQCN